MGEKAGREEQGSEARKKNTRWVQKSVIP